MSRALVVDQRYRLQPHDLSGASLRVVIQNITFQGVEELAPVLHFVHAPAKHLVLDGNLRRELITITQSSLYDDWIGRAVELQPVLQDGDVRIGLTAPGRPGVRRTQASRFPIWVSQRLRAYGQVVLLLIVLIVLLVVVSLLENSQQLWQTVLDYLS